MPVLRIQHTAVLDVKDACKVLHVAVLGGWVASVFASLVQTSLALCQCRLACSVNSSLDHEFGSSPAHSWAEDWACCKISAGTVLLLMTAQVLN